MVIVVSPKNSEFLDPFQAFLTTASAFPRGKSQGLSRGSLGIRAGLDGRDLGQSPLGQLQRCLALPGEGCCFPQMDGEFSKGNPPSPKSPKNSSFLEVIVVIYP